jgi:flagellar biosynthetic protein FlhB
VSDESDLEKSEAPTAHRLKKAREDGNIPRSRELTSMLMMFSGLGLLWVAGAGIEKRLAAMISHGVSFDSSLVKDNQQMLHRAAGLIADGFIAMLPIFAGLVLVALAAPMLIGGLMFSFKAFEADFSRLNPLPGIKRMFSMQVLVELFKSLLKVVVVGWICGLYLLLNWSTMLNLFNESLVNALNDGMHMIIVCGLFVVLGLVPIVGIDIFWQVWNNLKKLRMSKQDIRDEFKSQEGDPHVKARIRQQQRAMAKRRMMSDVPKADVIVTNPTHYAVALQYTENKMSAPRMLAKGAGEVALHIKQLGSEHRIPVLEAPPLARALYRHCEIGHQIPTALYAAVAEVLAWVYQLKRWKHQGGMAPKRPQHLPVPKDLDFAHEQEMTDDE